MSQTQPFFECKHCLGPLRRSGLAGWWTCDHCSKSFELPGCSPAGASREVNEVVPSLAAPSASGQQAGTPLRVVPAVHVPAPVVLHPETADLVARFASALSEKLLAAQEKYGYSDGWASADWMDECRVKPMEHVTKGDPRDVAAYCAFLWHHGASTVLVQAQEAAPSVSGQQAGTPCYQCGVRVGYLFADSRCGRCTRVDAGLQ